MLAIAIAIAIADAALIHESPPEDSAFAGEVTPIRPGGRC